MWQTLKRRYSAPCLAMLLVAAVPMGGCAPTIAGYQEQAYRNATTLKAETHAMMAKADSEDFAGQKDAVARTTVAIDAATNYAAGVPQNRISAEQWRLYKSGIYDRFVETWKAQGKVSSGYRIEQQRNSDQAFDFIICLEANKRSSMACTAAGGGQ